MSKSDDMPIYISAIAETVKLRYKGRASALDSPDIAAMERGWRRRLSDALKASGKSARAVSLAAGCGAGYLHDVLKAGKDPTIDRLLKITDVLGVSLSWVVYGITMDKQDEELLRVFATMTQKQRAAMLDLAPDEADNDH